MSLQNQINLSVNTAFAGQRISTPSASLIDSYAAGASGIFFGCGVFQGASADTVVPGNSSMTPFDFIGFVARDPFNENAPGAGFTIQDGDSLAIVRFGEMYVVANVPMAFTDKPYLIINDADPTNIGKLTNINSPGNTIDISSFVKLMSSTVLPNNLIKISIFANGSNAQITQGTHVTTWSGVWATPKAGNITYTKIGNMVTLMFPQTIFPGGNTLNNISMDTELPAALRPAFTLDGQARNVQPDGDLSRVVGSVFINSDGNIFWGKDAEGTAFDATEEDIGFVGTSVTYLTA